MEAISKQNYNYDTWSQELIQVEIASDFSRAILSIPLIHIGSNKKGLFWTKQMIEEVAPLFKGAAFRYDLDGQEGSSHTTNKLSSPHFDVGWTYKNDGAYIDKQGTMWVKGEVTHPQVIDKLSRKTTDGQREINFASMGVIVEEAICSICGSEYGTCEHERNKSYNMETAYKVPTKVSKALHVALTNDPADGEAEIKECIFQEMGGDKMFTKKKEDNQVGPQSNNESPAKSNEDKENNTDNMSPNENKLNPTQKMNTEGIDQGKASTDDSQIPGGLAPSSHISEQLGAAPSPQDILKDLAERVKTIEQSVALGQESPELINASPQDQFTQDNMGNTSQFDQEKQTEDVNMVDKNDGQTSNEQTPVNPDKTEVQDVNMDPMGQIMQVLQQILVAVGGNQEMQDMGKESMDASKGMIKKSEPDTLGHEGAGDMVGEDTDESNKKNKSHMNEPGKVATADSEVEKLKTEMADMTELVKQMREGMELQDNTIPEFGGQGASSASTEVADMTAEQRRENFGEYGGWDACFNGAESAAKFKRGN